MSFTFAAFFAAATVVVCASARPISLVLRRFPGRASSHCHSDFLMEAKYMQNSKPNLTFSFHCRTGGHLFTDGACE